MIITLYGLPYKVISPSTFICNVLNTRMTLQYDGAGRWWLYDTLARNHFQSRDAAAKWLGETYQSVKRGL